MRHRDRQRLHGLTCGAALAGRRAFLARAALGASATLLGGCAATAGGSARDRIIDLRRGQDTDATALLAEMRAADVVLLGELHDNPAHHAQRAALLAALSGSASALVVEYLNLGQTVAALSEPPLLTRLQAAGFDAAGWRWPLHRPLFEAALTAGLPIEGGNLARERLRALAAASPPVDLQLQALRDAVAAVPLSPAAAAQLDADLLAGHCGKLPADRLPLMRGVQRTRDAAMWSAIARRMQPGAGRPVLLLAGNGHVRRDYGVPTFACAAPVPPRLLSVGFGELGGAGEPDDSDSARYDLWWLTPPAVRDDPCANFAGAARG